MPGQRVLANLCSGTRISSSAVDLAGIRIGHLVVVQSVAISNGHCRLLRRQRYVPSIHVRV